MDITIINCFDTYEHRVDLLVRAFSNVGYTVQVLTSNFKHIEKKRIEINKKGYIYFDVQPYSKNLSVARMLSHIRLSKSIFQYVEQHCSEIDVLWILIPPNTFVRDAAAFKISHTNIKLIYDFIDLWPETMPINRLKNIWPFTEWKTRRSKYVSSGDYIVTECNLYQKIMKDEIKATPCTTLYLARDLKPFIPASEPSQEKLLLCYLGSINHIIDIDVISDIIRQATVNMQVELHIIGDGENREKLIDCSKLAGANVVFHGKVYDAIEKKAIYDKCHFGLNIMKKSVCVGLTMKSMDYFEAGLPIINNIHGDTWDFVDNFEIGINYTETMDFVNAMKKSFEIRKKVRSFYENTFDSKLFCEKAVEIIDTLFKS